MIRLPPIDPEGRALRYKGGRTRVTYFAEEGVFLRPPHVRDFVNEGYFFTQVRSMRGKNPLTIHEVSAALTPSDYRSDYASESAAAKQADDYNIKS